MCIKMKFTYAVLILCTLKMEDILADHYWRDYDGTIPCDAIQGGTDSFGYYTYIGVIAASDVGSSGLPDIVSATIYKGDDYAYAAYHSKVYKSNKGVKILCSSVLDKYHWTYTFKNGCALVKGSYAANYTNYYIGRTSFHEQNVTGRFSVIDRILHVPWKNTPNTLQTFNSFEMLMYCTDTQALGVHAEK